MAGKEFVVDKAMCMCKYGAAPGKLMVTDNQFFRLNGTKLCASTMTLGNVIYPPGFGICKVNPMFPKPCVPAITQWNGQFSKITMMGGNPLTDKSKGTCSCGGPDCIEFMQTGQIPVPGSKQMQQATGEHQGELDAMGDPSALTKHPVDTPTSLLLKEGNILVKAVKGEAESFSGQTLIYEVEHYNTPIVSDEIRSHVKWKVTIGEKEETVDQPGTDVLELSVKEEWQGKKLCVQAYINQPSDNVKVNTQIKKWEFPIIIDRYKMPGLNETGTDIADDMAYGYGFKSARPVYTTEELQAYKKQYENNSFDESVHALFSNAKDFEQPEPETDGEQQRDVVKDDYPVMEADKTRVDRTNYDLRTKLVRKRGKAIYSKEDKPSLKSLTPTSTLSDLERLKTTIKPGFNEDDALFEIFQNMASVFSITNAALRNNIIKMIHKFRSNSGGVYENPALTSAVEQHPSTERYCKELEEYMRNQLSKHKGDVGMLEDKQVYWKIKGSTKQTKDHRNTIRAGKNFSLTPQYDGGVKSEEKRKKLFDGVGIALGDIWATEISILDYQLHNDGSYKLTYQVTLLDHFGLNKEDLKWYFSLHSDIGNGFVSWFLLQHFHGYKPFITRIIFKRSFRGKIEKA